MHSQRLQSICDLVDARTTSLVDVGYDHGLVLHWAARRQIWPLIGIEQQVHFARQYRQRHAGDRCLFLSGDGIAALSSDLHCDCLVITGIGEEQIRRVCCDLEANSGRFQQLIISPSSIDLQLRPFLNKLGWRADHEDLVQERGRWYSISRLRPGTETATELRQRQIGPRLFEQQHPLLPAYLKFVERRFYRSGRSGGLSSSITS